MYKMGIYHHGKWVGNANGYYMQVKKPILFKELSFGATLMTIHKKIWKDWFKIKYEI
jgi:hypothetical protein